MNKNEPILRSLATIEANILKKLTVETLAGDIHFSKRHYQHMFREIVGDSVMHYVARRKITFAAKELATTDATILEIALKYGYESHEGFTRSFQSIMGVSPSKYRAYHLAPNLNQTPRGEFIMTYAKNMEPILKELNALIVEIKETALSARKIRLAADGVYTAFWDSVTSRTEALADDLQTVLSRITEMTQCPDEISNRFLLMKTMEDTAFRSYVLSLQVGLTVSRAQPTHREKFQPVCDCYRSFAKNAEVKVEKLVAFYKELAALIFSDMRENAKQLLQTAIEKGNASASILTNDKEYPYAYLADEITSITNKLSALPLDGITLSLLEDCKFQLDIISTTADIDALRTPSHKQLFDSIFAFRESINEAAEFFRLLSTTLTPAYSESALGFSASDSLGENTKTHAWKLNIILFYLKGELQKLGASYLTAEQQTAFDAICQELGQITQSDETVSDRNTLRCTAEALKIIYDKLTTQAKELGTYGSAIQYLAEELLLS